MAVYFVQQGTDGPIKIGYALNVQRRMTALKGSNPNDLLLRLTLPGDFEAEAELHKRFAHSRLNGEWFQPTPDLLAFIAQAGSLGSGDTADEPPHESRCLAQSIGNAFRAARKLQSCTQLDVAAKAGMSQQNYARIEYGKTNVTIDSLLRIGAALGLRVRVVLEPVE